MSEVLRDAHARLKEIREGDHPEAGGLVIAADKEHAERIALRLGRLLGARPPIVTSDDPGASKRIAEFSKSKEPWLVSVLMVSEGVDIPRLRVGVYATAARTELFFRQVVGRFIRRTPLPRAQMAHLYMPADMRLKQLAVAIEEERNHALQQETAGELEPREVAERAEPENAFHALSSSARAEDDLIYTTLPGDQLGLFGGAPTPPRKPAAAPAEVVPESASEKRERLREKRQSLVSAISRRTGEPHRSIHARMNARTGAQTVAKATVTQLEKSIVLLEREYAKT
jgi:superfamily II DNA or RNA helicase